MKPGAALGIAIWLIFFAISVSIRLFGKRRDSSDGGHGDDSRHGRGDGGGDGGH